MRNIEDIMEEISQDICMPGIPKQKLVGIEPKVKHAYNPNYKQEIADAVEAEFCEQFQDEWYDIFGTDIKQYYSMIIDSVII